MFVCVCVCVCVWLYVCGDGVDRCIMGLCVCVDLCVESVLEVKGEREAVGKPRKM